MLKNLLTQNSQPFGGGFQGFGQLGGETSNFANNTNTAVSLFNKFISVFIGVLTLAAGIWFIIQFFIGAFGWLTAGSDKASLEGARKRLTNAIIGLIIVVAAIFIIELLGRIVGLDILNPGNFILNIWRQ